MTQITLPSGFSWPWNSTQETRSLVAPPNASLVEPTFMEDPLKEITLDMMTIKVEALHRAYGREDILRDLVSKLPEGFVVLLGYSGCGKTTLVHEIVWRIRHNQIPSLQNATVHQFKLRLAKGPAGALGNLYQWCVGGVKGSLKELIKQHIQANSTGKIQILFFDEIQDLLTENMAIFDEFKEEIGNNNLKIIGATTNKEIVHELRKGEGMKRRVAVIEVPTMTTEQTQQALPHLSPFKTPFPKPFNYQMDQETAAAIVALSSFHNEDVLPSSAMSLLKAVVTDLYDSTLRQGESSAVLTVQYVVDFIASTKRVPTLDLWQKIGPSGNELISPESVQKELFPQIDPKKAAGDSTQALACQLSAFYHDQNRDSLLVLEGESELFLREVLAHWVNGSSSAFICNVQKLARATETSKKLSFAKEAFAKLFSGRRPVPLMVLTNIPAAWRRYLILEETLEPPSNPQALQHVVSKTVNDLLPMLLQRGIQQLSPSRVSTQDKNGPSAVSAGQPALEKVAEQLMGQCSQPSTSASPPSEAKKTNLPVMVEWLFQRLLEERIPLLVLNTADKQINVEKTSWGKIEVKALEFLEIVKWMEDRLQKRGSSLDNGWITKMVFAIYLLKNSPVDSVANIAAKTVDELSRSQTSISDKDLIAAIQNAFSGMKRGSEIDDALKRAEAQWEQGPLQTIETQAISEFSFPLPYLDQLCHCQMTTVLMLGECGVARQQWIRDQIAAYLHSKNFGLAYLNYSQIQYLPGELKRVVLNRHFDRLRFKGVVMIDEEGLNDRDLQTVFSTKPYKLICFKKSSTQTQQTVAHLVTQGAELLNIPQLSEAVSAITSTPAQTSFPLNKIECSMGPLDDAEALQLLKHQIGSTAPNLLHLYKFYADKEGIDRAYIDLQRDAPLVAGKGIEEMCNYFYNCYGKSWKMSLDEVKYIADPSLASKGTRLQKWVSSIFSSMIFLPMAGIKWLGQKLKNVVSKIVFSLIRDSLSQK